MEGKKTGAEFVIYRKIESGDDAAIARIIRENLEANHLDIPGTAYFDEHLDHISTYYLANPSGREYFILTDVQGRVIGGIGLAECDLFEDCAELQKLYLCEDCKGSGLGYDMIRKVEERARELGYRQIYLETPTNLEAALHIYARSGYRQIPKPEAVVHSAMNCFLLKKL
jgi:putative acetyltransferase